MKFFKLFSILIIFCITNSNTFNLLVWGDGGQIEHFWKTSNVYYDKANPKRPDPKLTGESIYFQGPNKEIINADIDMKSCTVTQGKSPVNLSPDFNGMRNFRKVLCASADYILNAHQIVYLGDMVYVENKKGSMLKKGYAYAEFYEKRNICGYFLLKDLLSNFTKYCPKVPRKEAIQKIIWNKATNKPFDNLYFLEGNHSFDASYNLESQLIDKLNIAKGYYIKGTGKEQLKQVNYVDSFKHPRIVKVPGPVKVEFLDINTQMLNLGFASFQGSDAFNNMAKKLNMGKAPNIMDCLNYVNYTFDAINRFSKNADWKIVRSHHSPFNIEGGFNELANFWTFKEKRPKKECFNKTILECMVFKGVRIYLASHHHSAHVVAFPLKNIDNLVQGKCTITSPKAEQSKTGCAYIDPNIIKQPEGSLSIDQICEPEKGKKYIPPNYNFKTDFQDPNKGYFYVFVAGNGGRYFDPMTDSSLTKATLIWGKGAKNNSLADQESQKYGGLNIKFNKNDLLASFFEEDNFNPREIAKFKIQKGSADNSEILESIDSDSDIKCNVDTHSS